MHSDTRFVKGLSHTTQDPKEAREFLIAHRPEELPVFTENLQHCYDTTAKEFQVKIDNEPFRFTYAAYIEFCSRIGIPGKFADRIPDELLLQCVETMLGDESNKKLRMVVRDKNVIVGCKKDGYISTDPASFLEASGGLFNNHLFREASISDEGTAILFEPMSGQTIHPNAANVEDLFNIGIAFRLGHEPGLVTAQPYSLRHVCTNVAISASEVPKYNLVEKLKSRATHKYYERLLENYQSDRYGHYLTELNARLERLLDQKLSFASYDRAFSQLGKLLGKEVAWSLMGVTEDTHNELMEDIRYRKTKRTLSDSEALTELSSYEIFNGITAAAKGYEGLERTKLQLIGGELV